MLYASTAETCDVPFELPGLRDQDRWPLIRTEPEGSDDHHTDGYINPPM
jgi:hypothetical protein